MSALETMMPKVQYAELGDVRLAYYEAGPKAGTPVVFCHGFPELAFSWRHQLKACEAAGRWAIAPDQPANVIASHDNGVHQTDVAQGATVNTE